MSKLQLQGSTGLGELAEDSQHLIEIFGLSSYPAGYSTTQGLV